MTAKILVVGGAGYIGTHMVKMLGRERYRAVAFDNLATGYRDAVISGDFFAGDLVEPRDIARVLAEHAVDVVMHFAAHCYVGESVEHPRKYYRNNVLGTLNLLDEMLDAGVRKFVFSSTCSTYGVPETVSISESHPQRPVNPYGRTKLTIEHVLADYAQAYGLQSVSLRYFNAAGCDPEGALGERHDPETHLIPLVLREALRVKRGGDPAATALRVYGGDFDTPEFRYARRDLRARLRPCARPLPGAPDCDRPACRRTGRGRRGVQPGYRARILGQGSDRNMPGGVRRRYTLSDRGPPGRRSAAARGRCD